MDGFQCNRPFLTTLQYEQHGSHQEQYHIQLLQDWQNKMKHSQKYIYIYNSQKNIMS